MEQTTKLAYEVGVLRGFIKNELPYLPEVRIKDMVGYRLAVEAAIMRIEQVAKEYAERVAS